MRKLLTVLLAVMATAALKAQECKDVKTGMFRIPADDYNPKESILIRTPEHQIEEVKADGVKMQFDIKWTSDCTYELSKPKVLKGKVPFEVSDSQVLYVKITKVTSSYYTAEITANFGDIKLVKDIQIVKQ